MLLGIIVTIIGIIAVIFIISFINGEHLLGDGTNTDDAYYVKKLSDESGASLEDPVDESTDMLDVKVNRADEQSDSSGSDEEDNIGDDVSANGITYRVHAPSKVHKSVSPSLSNGDGNSFFIEISASADNDASIDDYWTGVAFMSPNGNSLSDMRQTSELQAADDGYERNESGEVSADDADAIHEKMDEIDGKYSKMTERIFEIPYVGDGDYKVYIYDTGEQKTHTITMHVAK